MQTLDIYIDGEFRQSESVESIPVINPATQEFSVNAPLTTTAEIDLAVASAQQAFLQWRDVPASERVRMMMSYQMLLKEVISMPMASRQSGSIQKPRPSPAAGSELIAGPGPILEPIPGPIPHQSRS